MPATTMERFRCRTSRRSRGARGSSPPTAPSNDALRGDLPAGEPGEPGRSSRYALGGQRLSQVTVNTDGSKEDAYYGYNPHTDVETLTDQAGDTKATYGYTAYGS